MTDEQRQKLGAALLAQLIDRELLEEVIDKDPQTLVDEAVEFGFKDVEGRVKLVDGVAAGGPWHQFEFLTGPYAGKKPFFAGGFPARDGFKHIVNASDDGMRFNETSEIENTDGDSWGGDPIPELDGETVFIVD